MRASWLASPSARYVRSVQHLLLTRTVQQAREAIAVLENAPPPTTPAGAETRIRALAVHRDIERAYGELLGALSSACGAICAPI